MQYLFQSADNLYVRFLVWYAIPTILSSLMRSLVTPAVVTVVGIAVYAVPNGGIRCVAAIVFTDFV
jgi:hypothetical protein